MSGGQEREALAYLRGLCDEKGAFYSGQLGSLEAQDHAATIVRAALASDAAPDLGSDSDMLNARTAADVVRVLRGWAAACRSHSYSAGPFMQGVRTGNSNAADGYDEAATALAALTRDAPAVASPTPLDVLRQIVLHNQTGGRRPQIRALLDAVEAMHAPADGAVEFRQDERAELRGLIHDALQTVAEAATELHAANPRDLGVADLNEAKRKLIRARAIADGGAS